MASTHYERYQRIDFKNSRHKGLIFIEFIMANAQMYVQFFLQLLRNMKFNQAIIFIQSLKFYVFRKIEKWATQFLKILAYTFDNAIRLLDI